MKNTTFEEKLEIIIKIIKNNNRLSKRLDKMYNEKRGDPKNRTATIVEKHIDNCLNSTCVDMLEIFIREEEAEGKQMRTEGIIKENFVIIDELKNESLKKDIENMIKLKEPFYCSLEQHPRRYMPYKFYIKSYYFFNKHSKDIQMKNVRIENGKLISDLYIGFRYNERAEALKMLIRKGFDIEIVPDIEPTDNLEKNIFISFLCRLRDK